jgi:hypothetical protein
VIATENDHECFTVGEVFQTVQASVYGFEVEVDSGASECKSHGANRR